MFAPERNFEAIMARAGTVATIAWQSPGGNILTTKSCAKKKIPPTSATANNFNVVEMLKGPKVDDLMISDTVDCKIIQMISICGGEAREAYLGGNAIVLFSQTQTYLLDEHVTCQEARSC